MKFWKHLLGVSLVSLLLGACGGGGGGGGSGSPCAAASCGTASSSSSSSSSSGGTSTNYQVTLVSSSATILTNGTDFVTLQAIVQDASLGAAAGVPVSFAVTSGGGAISASSATTNSSGIASVTYSTNTAKSNRTVTISATVAGTSATTSATTSLVASGTTLSISGLTSTVVGQSLVLEAVLVDAGNNAIANQAVALTLTSGSGTLSTASATTNSQGKASFTYIPPGTGGTTAVISATALGASASTTIQVAGIAFSFTSPTAGTQVNVSTCIPTPLTVQLTGASGPLTFATSLGALYSDSACTVGGNSTLANVALSGSTASVWARATNTGLATVTAVTPGNTATTSTTLQYISSTPATMTLNASPSTVSASAVSTITAFVKDATGNPAANQAVFFSSTGGGTISGSATTDVNGVATATFTAGATLTGLNGITITATIPSASPVITTTTQLTIAGQGVTVDIGFDNKITPANPLFSKSFVVTVLDSNRSPVAGQTVTMSLNVNNYRKGFYYVPTNGTGWQLFPTPTVCANEDTNNNGVRDGSELDVNGNSKLDPVTGAIIRNVSGTSSGSAFTATTGSDGKVTLVLEYPQNQAGWVQVTVAASASVQGLSSTATAALWLPELASDYTDVSVSPPNVTSPYGTQTSCNNPL